MSRSSIEDVVREFFRRRTAVVIRELKEKGKLYHRPSLLHYIALWLAGKKEFRELTREDIERAKSYVREFLKPYIELGVPLYRIHKLFLEHFSEVYKSYPQAPRSYQSFYRLVKSLKQ